MATKLVQLKATLTAVYDLDTHQAIGVIERTGRRLEDQRWTPFDQDMQLLADPQLSIHSAHAIVREKAR